MNEISRRKFLALAARSAGAAALAGVSAPLLLRSRDAEGRWRIDAGQCTACGLCETRCVTAKSAVVCRNDYDACGFCTHCHGYAIKDNSAAEAAMRELDAKSGGASSDRAPVVAKPDQLVCPHDALKRRRVGETQYEYAVDEDLCTGCGKCVSLCKAHGNGSLKLFVRQDRCQECNRCTIAADCPTSAIRRG